VPYVIILIETPNNVDMKKDELSFVESAGEKAD
jgi:hypothetical protein